MSRLKPFFGGLTPPAVVSQGNPGVGGPAQLKQLQMLEQDVEPLTSSLIFVSKESIDASIQVRMFVSSSFMYLWCDHRTMKSRGVHLSCLSNPIFEGINFEIDGRNNVR